MRNPAGFSCNPTGPIGFLADMGDGAFRFTTDPGLVTGERGGRLVYSNGTWPQCLDGHVSIWCELDKPGGSDCFYSLRIELGKKTRGIDDQSIMALARHLGLTVTITTPIRQEPTPPGPEPETFELPPPYKTVKEALEALAAYEAKADDDYLFRSVRQELNARPSSCYYCGGLSHTVDCPERWLP